MDLLSEVFLLFAFASVGIVLYVIHCYTYWKKRGVYVPCNPTLIFGNTLPMLRGTCTIRDYFKDIYNKLQRNSQTMGGIYILLKPCLVVTDLDVVKNILNNDFDYFTDRILHSNASDPISVNISTSKGERWRQIRTQLTPAFTPAKIKRMFSKIVTCSDEFVDFIRKRYVDKEMVELRHLVDRFTIRIAASSVFGIECDSLNNTNTEFEYYLKSFYSKSLRDVLVTFLSFFNPGMLDHLKIRSVRKDVGEFFLKLTSENLKFRKGSHHVRNGYIDQLATKLDNLQPPMSDAHIAGNCLMMAVAEHESSAPVISFCLYELAINADIQNRVRGEVIEVLARYNGNFCYDAVNDMSYLDKCVKETLRLYAPAPVHLRECTKQYRDQLTGTLIDQGTLIFIPAHGFHMDPNIYPNPERFDPERFSNDAISSRHPCAWTPFGFGPRMCIGMKTGVTKIKACLAKLLQNFEFSTTNLTEIPAISPKVFVTNFSNDVRLKITEAKVLRGCKCAT